MAPDGAFPNPPRRRVRRIRLDRLGFEPRFWAEIFNRPSRLRMNCMVFNRVKTRICAAAPALQLSAAAITFAALLGASPARAQAPQEDTNPLNSVLGFVGMQFDKDKEDIDYRARAPIVVPPRLDLPKPKQVARNADWPKDPNKSGAIPPPPPSGRRRRSRRTRAPSCRNGSSREIAALCRQLVRRTSARRGRARRSVSTRLGRFCRA
jgi:hypothetical protein